MRRVREFRVLRVSPCGIWQGLPRWPGRSLLLGSSGSQAGTMPRTLDREPDTEVERQKVSPYCSGSAFGVAFSCPESGLCFEASGVRLPQFELSLLPAFASGEPAPTRSPSPAHFTAS
jgi:hypothetical protein